MAIHTQSSLRLEELEAKIKAMKEETEKALEEYFNEHIGFDYRKASYYERIDTLKEVLDLFA